MNDQHQDPLLDSCLEEVLGGQTPPNLAPQILRAFRQLQPGNPEQDRRPASVGVVETPQDESRPVVLLAPALPASASSDESSPWGGLVAAAGIVATGTLLGLAALYWEAPSGGRPVNETDVPRLAGSPDPTNDPPPPQTVARDTIADLPSEPVSRPDFGAQSPLDSITTDTPIQSKTALAADRVVERLNQLMRSQWQDAHLVPTAPLNDEAWCHRSFQRLIGRAPTDAEVVAFLEQPSAGRRTGLVEALCGPGNYRPDFAKYWADRWTDILLHESGSATDDQRVALSRYLEESFADGVGVSELTRKLLTATGAASDQGGAPAYLLAHAASRPRGIAAHTARVFLGHRLDCARCHDHPENSLLSQRAFWEWTAFFKNVRVDGSARLAERTGRGTRSAIFFETPQGEVKAAYPRFPGTSSRELGLAAASATRTELAEALVASDLYARAMANRIWSLVFGYGLTTPVDDMGEHNSPAHPAALGLLADQFAAYDFDLAQITGWIARSEAFGLQTAQPSHTPGDPTTPASLNFAHFYQAPATRPLPALLIALRSEQTEAPSDGTTAARLAPSGPPSGVGLSDDLPTSATERSLRVTRLTHTGPPPLVAGILNSPLSFDAKLNHLFGAVLRRFPRSAERRAIRALFQDSDPDHAELWLDVWWAATQSDEFRP